MSQKHCIIILFLFCCKLSANTQTSNSFKEEDYDIAKFKIKKISIAPPQESIHFTNIAHIEVLDARADTAEVGFMQKNTRKPIFVGLNNGLKNEAQQFVNTYCKCNKNDSSRSVLMVIKKLWLSDELDQKDQKYENNKVKIHSDKMHMDDADEDTSSGIVVKIEFYSKIKLNYYALYRYDSILSGVHSVSYFGSDYLSVGLTESLSKLTYMDHSIFSVIANRKPFSLEEIKEHNSKSFDLAILKDTALKSGVYVTFEEFKTNKPSKIDFEIKKEKLTDIVYIKEADGKEYPIRDIWGYSDGKKTFVKSLDNFFLLQRKENAFYIYGSKQFTRDRSRDYIPNATPGFVGSSGIFVPSVQTGEQSIKLRLKPYQLDWDTGKLY